MKILAIAFLSAVLHAQEPAGAIEVVLRDAVTRAPVDGARILLRGAVARNATTTPDGGFRFAQLASGDYSVAIEKSGYLDTTRGLDAKAVRLKPGAVTETVVVDLTPLGAMEGAVLGEDNKPLGGVTVTVADATHTTGKDGRFVFEDLVPGSYQVAVGVPHAVRSSTLVRDASTGDFYGYGAAQYYPGADDARLAIPVDVPAGTRLRNVDLRLRRSLLVEFSGKLVEMAGRKALFDADVQLMGAVPGTPDPLWRRHRVGTDGGFRFSLLQPGSYTLAIYVGGHSLPYLFAFQLDKAGTEELDVPVPPFPLIQGTVSLRDPKLQWQGLGSVRLIHRTSASETASLTPDGSFEFAGVPPGEYTVEVQSQNLRLTSDSTHKLFARELHFGTQTGLRKPITVVENGNPPLEIELSDGPAGIAGKVVDSGARGGEYVVRVARTGPRRGSISAMAIATDDFQFPELAPGDYEITAWRLVGGISSVLISGSPICDETVKVTVRDGTVSNVMLRPCQ